MKLLFSKSAAQAYATIKADAPEFADKIKAILKDTLLHPDAGVGNPTRLDGSYCGLWLRTYAPGQVVIYLYDDEHVTVASVGARDVALKQIHLEAYSEQEERSVMDQMAANRGKDGEPKVGIFWYNRATHHVF